MLPAGRLILLFNLLEQSHALRVVVPTTNEFLQALRSGIEGMTSIGKTPVSAWKRV